MRLVIASTHGEDGVTLDELNAMRNHAFCKTLYHEDQLWVVSEAETIPVVDVVSVADRDKTYILIVDLKLVADAENQVVTDCEMCGRVSHLRPDQAELGGVPLDVCLRDQQFTRVLVRLMKKQHIDTDLCAVLRGTIKPED